MHTPIKTHTNNFFNCIQKIYQFPNNHGARVVRHSGSYGHEQGLWELAVIKFRTDGRWDLIYDTPITNDVIGYLTEEGVQKLLDQIAALPETSKF